MQPNRIGRAASWSTIVVANAGSAAAQYEIARALHYCDESWRTHFTSASTGAIKTPEEIHRLYEKLPANIQKLLNDANQRCQSFSDNLSLLKGSGDWLDKAAKMGYSPAIFMQADLMLKSNLITGDAAHIQQARQMALSAVTSADPEVLFGMGDFVDGTDKSFAQSTQLVAAWLLLGCERGNDCSAESDWIRANCTIEPQCDDNPTVIAELEREYGAKFPELQHLAEQIAAAVDSRDVEAIKKYL